MILNKEFRFFAYLKKMEIAKEWPIFLEKASVSVWITLFLKMFMKGYWMDGWMDG